MIPLHDDNPTQTAPVLTVALIALCIVVFLWQWSLGPVQSQAVYALGVIPAIIFDHARLPTELEWVAPVLTPVTSMFLHGGFMHLAGNMLYLWIFGNNIEDAMGRGRFLVFYLLCGIAAVLAQALPDTRSTVPMIGASGAISGVLFAFCLFEPFAMLGIMFIIPMPAILFAVLYVALSIYASRREVGRVAHEAHLGGALGGLALTILLYPASLSIFLQQIGL